MTAVRDASSLRGATLYLDCFAGISGDMTLGALLDLGVPEEAIRGPLSALPLSGWSLQTYRVRKGAVMGTKADVVLDLPVEPSAMSPHARADQHEHEPRHEHGDAHAHAHDDAHAHPHDDAHEHVHEHAHAHVHYAEIRRMIQRAELDPDIVRRALGIFDRIALVEAEIHGVSVDQVSFHEVGAVDSIIDIVGTAAALSWLRPQRVLSRTVPLGAGTIKTAHGHLPVPAPATLALLRGAPVETGGAQSELTTPTGAGIIAAVASGYGPIPAMRVLGTGWGAGTRELPDRPNMLRVVAGVELVQEDATAAGRERCVVVEANIDDMNPELYEPLMEGLFLAGARDVWLVPVHMKKNRPGVLVGALCDVELREALVTVLLRESTTLGVRTYGAERVTLQREMIEVDTPYGSVAVKLGKRQGEVWNAAPEYAACRRRAAEHGVPVKLVYSAALAAAAAR